MVASRIENLGMDPWGLGGELWGCEPRGFRGGPRLHFDFREGTRTRWAIST